MEEILSRADAVQMDGKRMHTKSVNLVKKWKTHTHHTHPYFLHANPPSSFFFMTVFLLDFSFANCTHTHARVYIYTGRVRLNAVVLIFGIRNFPIFFCFIRLCKWMKCCFECRGIFSKANHCVFVKRFKEIILMAIDASLNDNNNNSAVQS